MIEVEGDRSDLDSIIGLDGDYWCVGSSMEVENGDRVACFWPVVGPSAEVGDEGFVV
jgi:hypothetical protein